VEEAGLPSFKTLARTIQNHYLGILNFFNNRQPTLLLNLSTQRSTPLEMP
jgi:hypothetical protein